MTKFVVFCLLKNARFDLTNAKFDITFAKYHKVCDIFTKFVIVNDKLCHRMTNFVNRMTYL